MVNHTCPHNPHSHDPAFFRCTHSFITQVRDGKWYYMPGKKVVISSQSVLVTKYNVKFVVLAAHFQRGSLKGWWWENDGESDDSDGCMW